VNTAILGSLVLSTLLTLTTPACDDVDSSTREPGVAASPSQGSATMLNINSLQAPVSTCNIASGCAVDGVFNGGEFRVEALDNSTEYGAATLVLVKAWGATMPATVELPLRYQNASAVDAAGIERLNASLEELSIGEEIGLIFGQRIEEGPCWGANTVFRKAANGGYTDGSLFTRAAWSLDEISSILALNVQQLAAGEACSPNIHADNMPQQPAFDEPGVPGPPASSIPLPDGPGEPE